MTRAILLSSATAAVIFAAATAPAPAKNGASQPVTYTVTALPNPLGGTYAQGSSINNKRQIAGFATLTGNATMHAMLWQKKQNPIDMGTLGGPNSAVAWPNRNNRGEFAGIAETAEQNPLGETWSCAAAVFYTAPPTGDICLGFSWQNGTMTALPTLGGYDGFATGINNRGQIVGWAENAYRDPTCNTPQVLQFEAVIWGTEQNEFEQLPPYGTDPDGAATAINSKGQVVGISGQCANAVGGASAEHMDLWQKNTITSLPTLGGNYWNTPMDINDNGDVTGFSDLPGDSASSPNFNAFLWTKNGGTINLGTLSGDNISEGLGINASDQVVGVSYPSSHAFIWQNGTITDLNNLVGSNSQYLLIDAQEISDSGAITGEAQDTTSGAIVAFLATPQ
jgi:probable HAF family extracellular repeat protein